MSAERAPGPRHLSTEPPTVQQEYAEKECRRYPAGLLARSFQMTATHRKPGPASTPAGGVLAAVDLTDGGAA